MLTSMAAIKRNKNGRIRLFLVELSPDRYNLSQTLGTGRGALMAVVNRRPEAGPSFVSSSSPLDRQPKDGGAGGC